MRREYASLNLKQSIAEWNVAIAKGELGPVRNAISRLNVKQLTRQQRLPLANLCRRTHLFSLAVKLLYPVVQVGTRNAAPASVEETTEFCLSLLRIGSVLEVRNLLKTISEEAHPDVYLCQAFTAIVEWNYEAAISPLKLYISCAKISEYQRRVAKVNLAAALNKTSRHEESILLLQDLIAESRQYNEALIQSTCMMYLAESFLSVNDLKSAELQLKIAQAEFQLQVGNQGLQLDKIHAELLLKKGAAGDSHQISSIKARAIELKNYETARECDYLLAKYLDDEKAFLSFLVGTPYPTLKADALALSFLPPASCDVIRTGLGSADCGVAENSNVVDLAAPSAMKNGSALHRLLVALSSDFYRPQTIGSLHEAIFPNSYFNPFSSPNRVQQTIVRLRKWMSNSAPYWKVNSDTNGFYLQTAEQLPIRIPVSATRSLANPFASFVSYLKDSFGGRSFRAEDVIGAEIFPRKKVYEYLKEALHLGLLIRSGSARYTEYKIANL